MIVISEDHKVSENTGIGMISRAGKSTAFAHKAFQDEDRLERRQTRDKNSHLQEELIGKESFLPLMLI
jgi:hypothetical protein